MVPSPAPREGTLSPPRPERTRDGEVLELPAEPSAIVRAREFARAAAIDCKLDSTDCYEFVYAVSEAVTNAIKHGTPDAQGMITLTVARDSRTLTIAVRDCGSFHVPAVGIGSALESGRGLALMAQLADSVHLHSERSGTTVFLSKRLTADPTTRAPRE